MHSRYSKRQQNLIAALSQQDIDNLLVFNYENILYLTGYSGNAAYLLISKTGLWLITDYRYFERAKSESFGCEVICRDRDTETLGTCLKRLLPKGKTAFESNAVTVGAWGSIARDLNSDNLIPLNGAIELLRTIKDDWEVASIKKAAAIADLALADLLPQITQGVSELDLATELDYKMKKLGSDGVAFDTILLFNKRSALPHGKPGETTLKYGDFVLIDFGAVVNGYRSDMTRTYVLGEPSQKQLHMFETVLQAQKACFDTVKAGIECRDLNAVSETVLFNAGYKEYAGKGLGHGVGLFLHEVPFMSPVSTSSLQVGNVVTVEPGVYLPELGGVRMEDDVLITESGFEFLTHAPKEFILS